MRVNVNLASRKYEDARRFFVLWGTSLALVAVLTLVLGVLAYRKHANITQAALQARDLQQKIASLQKERNELRAIDNLPENRDVGQQKQFWNEQIFRRSLSWTSLLNELQRIMPSRAYLSSVQPELTPDRRVKLKLTIVGERKEDDLELIQRMEGSKRFHSTRPLTETLQRGEKLGMPPTYKFDIETYYIPAVTGPDSGSRKTAGKEGT
jgi:type IV pilus assembly protein PilN